ncbi:MAG: phosphate acyltransferase PlsX [Planctomycetes bacterium]|nr:phosphate acyltransferase PlsX [Planctomycetota bacterium]MBM4080603.1 phosphate acyltransferase PlsX [Planctomycetota bacterium]MBM4084267.1 phosphate acyltransferase PlsX [Planctomycetota bacterium]
MRIAVDAMGGDSAPAEIVKGSVSAAASLPDVEVVLVGDERKIQAELAKLNGTPKSVSVRHASEVVEMHEPPAFALKKKPDSSIMRSVELVARREAEAVLSAGNTGAAVGASIFLMGLLKGAKRPGIAVTVPTPKGQCTIIDVGANIKCKPVHLYQYGIMASIFSRCLAGKEKPKVGLLNVGEEDAKGTDLVKETFALLSKSSLNFVGNVEGRDIYKGDCDVVVCEGFVGNVVLKLSEALTQSVLIMLKQQAEKDVWAELGLALCKPALDGLKQKLDYTEYGGAPLLGVNGGCIICHGRSDARAIHNAVRAAANFGKYRVNDQIAAALETQP